LNWLARSRAVHVGRVAAFDFDLHGRVRDLKVMRELVHDGP